MDYILVLDYGTTTFKASVFNTSFDVVSSSEWQWEYSYPGDGRIECDPEVYISAAKRLIKDITTPNGFSDCSVAISVTGQAETLITIGKDGKAFDNAWVWLDTRAQTECNYFREKCDEKKFHSITGIPGFDPILPLLKLKYMRENFPERYDQTEKFLLLKDYVIYELTGSFETDYTVSSCTGYMDIAKYKWDKELLELAQIDETKLPKLVPPSHIAGMLRPDIARELGLSDDTIVISGMLDQCASALGCANTDGGIVCETTGTALAIAATLDNIPDNDDLPILCHGINGKYLALPNSSTAGALLKWYRDSFMTEVEKELKTGTIYKYIDSELEKRGRISDKLIMLPHFCGYMSPVVNPDATGVIYGLTLDTDRIDIAGAIMEGVSFLIRENLDLLDRCGLDAKYVLSLGGGAKSSLWLQMKANILNKAVVVPENSESTALGCAFGAAMSLGILNSADEFKRYIKIKKTYLPNEEKASNYDVKYKLYKKLNKDLGFYG